MQAEETDAFLEVMCEAFEMEFEAAKPIFHADPYFDPRNKYALKIDTKIVSCLTVVDRECWIGGALIRVAGIAGVSTRKEFRGQGLAGLLLAETVRDLTARGFHLSALFPILRDFYRRYGWETAGNQVTAGTLEAPVAAATSEVEVEVGLATEADAEALARLYNLAAGGRAMRCARDGRRWRYLLTIVPQFWVARGIGGAVEGYVLCDYQDRLIGPPPNTGVSGTVLRVLEFVCQTEAARLALRNLLAAKIGTASLEFVGMTDELSLNGFVPSGAPVESFMARILDWQGLLTRLSVNWAGFDCDLSLALIDPLLGAEPQVLAVRIDGNGAVVVPAKPTDTPLRIRNLIVGDILGWSTVAVGHCSGKAACDAGILRVSSTQAADLAGRLFPARSPFIPTADHF